VPLMVGAGRTSRAVSMQMIPGLVSRALVTMVIPSRSLKINSFGFKSLGFMGSTSIGFNESLNRKMEVRGEMSQRF